MLLFVVFITGACILILEITATRVLSPYFGNTIYTVSSVITTILLALSVGYYIGGKLADKHPSFSFFYGIIFLSGITTYMLFLSNIFILPLIAYLFPFILGPLISSILLFLLPNFLLAMLSPFVITLEKKRLAQNGIGEISGNVFFWSTLGSIFGSLSSGFFLIPFFGLDAIIGGVGIVLIFLGLVGFLTTKKKGKATLITVAIISLTLVTGTVWLLSQDIKKNVLYQKDGVYEKITIYDAQYQGKAARFFQQDRSNSGGMFLKSDALVDDYTKYFEIYKLFKPQIKNVFVIGGAAYTIPKAFLGKNKTVHVDVAEIEPSAFSLAKKYFNVPTTPRLTNYVIDGRRYLHDTNTHYDVIFSDVYYSLFSIPSHFTTKEFFQLSRKKLQSNGIFIGNLIGTLSPGPPSLLLSEMRTFHSVYPNSYFFAVDSPGTAKAQNIIFVGYNSNKKIDIKNISKEFPNDTFLQAIPGKLIDLNRFDLSLYPELTDNYAPVEYLTSKTLQQSFSNQNQTFQGANALAMIHQQQNFGSRYITSQAHTKEQIFITASLKALGQSIKTQTWQEQNAGKKYNLTNIMTQIFPEEKKRIILATHYDSIRYAHKDPSHPDQPMPGANDSASGVAVLLQLAQMLKDTSIKPHVGIDLIFFDGEEGFEDPTKKPWKPLGSEYFATHINSVYTNNKPETGIVLDMVCKKNLHLYFDGNSLHYAKKQVTNFWNIAKENKLSAFIPHEKYSIFDDHTSLTTAGIPSFLLIDFDDPYYLTTMDTYDKCSENSLNQVGNSVIKYIFTYK